MALSQDQKEVINNQEQLSNNTNMDELFPYCNKY